MEVMIPSDAKGHKHFRTPWICVLDGDQFLSNEAKRRQESPSRPTQRHVGARRETLNQLFTVPLKRQVVRNKHLTGTGLAPGRPKVALLSGL